MMIRELTGKTKEHLVFYKKRLIHHKTLASFLRLKEAAIKDGIDLYIVSSFRSFEAQKKIWNEKVAGIRALLDDEGRVIDPSSLSEEELIKAILRFSAYPGLSRHHWGTDFDLVDRAAFPTPSYKPELTTKESESYFKKFHEWFDFKQNRGEAFGFYRPYEKDEGLVAREPWHFSHYPVAKKYLYNLSGKWAYHFLKQSGIKNPPLVMKYLSRY